MSDAAIANIVTGVVMVVTTIVGFLTMYVKLKYGDKKTEEISDKIDVNTKITKAGTAVAAKNATVAAVTAAEAKSATQDMAESLSKKLNGGIDSAVEQCVKPLRDSLHSHMARYESDMNEIRESLNDIHKKLK